MKGKGSAIGLVLLLPQLWIAILAGMMALAGSNWEAIMDIARYAAERLAH
jgi:hypothetical protein